MADLKNTTEETQVERVKEREQQSIMEVHRAAEEAIQAIRDVAAATKALPDRASELLSSATVAEVFEFKSDHDSKFMVIELQDSNGFRYNNSGYNRNDGAAMPKGRYRALFFLVRID